MPTDQDNDKGLLPGSKFLYRIKNIEYLTAAEIQRKIVQNEDFETEKVIFGGSPIPFKFKSPKSLDVKKKKWSTDDEAKLAVALFESLSPTRDASVGLLSDPGIWAWIGLTQFPDYVINRWCDGVVTGSEPKDIKKFEYFLTGYGNHTQTRCALRRLYIAANASWRAENTFDFVHPFLEKADLFTSIFERNIGADAGLAVEIVKQYKDLTRKQYRVAIKLIGLILSTMSLEYIDEKEKKAIVAEAKAAISSGLVSE
jgi:hypothetical protein